MIIVGLGRIVITIMSHGFQVSENVHTATGTESLGTVAPPTISMASSSTSTSTSTIAGSNFPKPSSSRQYVSQGCTADLDRQKRTLPVRIDENMISLLMKLYQKLGEVPYVPPSYRQGSSDSPGSYSRVGDGPHFIQGVLDRAWFNSPECATVIDSIYKETQPAATSEGSGSKSEAKDLDER